jgi:hypothetical protein
MGFKIASHNILVPGKSNRKISGLTHFGTGATGMRKGFGALLLDITR